MYQLAMADSMTWYGHVLRGALEVLFRGQRKIEKL